MPECGSQGSKLFKRFGTRRIAIMGENAPVKRKLQQQRQTPLSAGDDEVINARYARVQNDYANGSDRFFGGFEACASTRVSHEKGQPNRTYGGRKSDSVYWDEFEDLDWKQS